MAEETKEAQTVEESPTQEEEQVQEETTEEVVKPAPVEEPVEDTHEKNWRALREENERLKNEAKERELIETPSALEAVKHSPAVEFYLSPEVQGRLGIDEVKAELSFPELESDRLFARVVESEYRRALDKYVTALSRGQSVPEPSVYRIAKQTKTEWESYVGGARKEGEEAGAKKAKQSVSEREATIEAEGRSDRGVKAADAAELSSLRRKSQKGDLDAVVKRLELSGL